jgi:hypothetical protein
VDGYWQEFRRAVLGHPKVRADHRRPALAFAPRTGPAAWLASALLPRTDVTVMTVEEDPGTAALAAQGDWPCFVELRCVNDMTATWQWDTKQHAKQQQVRQALLTSPLLTSVELRHGSGAMLSTRHA